MERIGYSRDIGYSCLFGRMKLAVYIVFTAIFIPPLLGPIPLFVTVFNNWLFYFIDNNFDYTDASLM